MLEVPIAFPLADESAPFYSLVEDEISLEKESTTKNKRFGVLPPYRDENNNVSSVSDLGDGYCVCVSPSGDSVIAITLIRKAEEPRVIHLNFHRVSPMIPIFATKAFRTSDTSFQLTVINADPIAFTFCFDLLTLSPMGVPVSKRSSTSKNLPVVRITRLRDVIQYKEQHASSSFHSNMVGFLSQDKIILALNTEVVAVDLLTEESEHWSLGATMEASQPKNPFLSVLPSFSANYRICDMQPVSAVHVHGTTVYTLHSDSTLNRWSVPHGSLLPSFIQSLPVDLPGNDVWESIQMTAASYPHVYCLALSIRCATPQPYNTSTTPPFLLSTTSTPESHPHVLLVITGNHETTTATTDSSTVKTLRLVVTDTNDLRHFHWTPQHSNLFTLVDEGKWYMYPHGVASSVVGLEPQRIQETFLDDHADEDRPVLRGTGTYLPPRNSLTQSLIDEPYTSAWWDAVEAAERTERTVVAVGTASGSTLIVVRPGSVAVIVQTKPPQPFSDEYALLKELDTTALVVAQEFAAEVEDFRAVVWESIANGSLLLDYRKIEMIKNNLFISVNDTGSDAVHAMPKAIRTAARKQFGQVTKAISELPPRWYTQWLAEDDHDGLRVALPHPLGYHSRLAASSLTIRFLEDVTQLILARCLVFAILGKTDQGVHVYLLTMSLLHMATRPMGGSTAIASGSSILDSTTSLTQQQSLIDAFIAERSSSSTTDLPKPCSFVGLPLYWSIQTWKSFLTSSVASSDPLFALIARGGEIENHEVALCFLSPKACLPNAAGGEIAILTARCLIHVSANHHDEATARKMALEAFQLMGSGANVLDNLLNIEQHIESQHVLVASLFHDHLKTLASNNSTAEHDEKLTELCLRAAIKTRNFSDALICCKKHPDPAARFRLAKRLVRSMVDEGALNTLIKLCSLNTVSNEDFVEGDSFNDIAVVVLQEFAQERDFYTAAVLTDRPPPDYAMALQTLHIHGRDWKQSAQCWDDRYCRALQALGKQSLSELSPTQIEEREGGIIRDLARCAFMCRTSVAQIIDPDDRYVVSGQERRVSIPLAIMDKRSVARLLDQVSDGQQGLNLVSLELRSRRAAGLCKLWMPDPHFAARAFTESETISDDEVFDSLCRNGFYKEALCLAVAADVATPGKLNIMLRHLCVVYLVPLMTPKAQPKPEYGPSMEQIRSALQFVRRTYLKDPNPSPLSVTLQGKSCLAAGIETSTIRVAVETLLQDIVYGLGSSQITIHEAVAFAMLFTHKYRRLPEWLESFMIWGTLPDAPLPGLFARRRLKDTPVDAFLGNSYGLFKIYMRGQLYVDAGRVVCKVLEGPGGDCWMDRSTARLPERGELDWIPGRDIDKLVATLTAILSQTTVKPRHRQEIVEAKTDISSALEKYCESLKYSRDGLLSARSLGDASA